MYSLYRKLVYKIIVNRGGYRITYSVAGHWIYLCVYIVADALQVCGLFCSITSLNLAFLGSIVFLGP
jgi:hypothetical protein